MAARFNLFYKLQRHILLGLPTNCHVSRRDAMLQDELAHKLLSFHTLSNF
jgi:hypothetical protein